MNKTTCNYSVIRFRPYADIDEFVNVGIIIECKAIGFIQVKYTNKAKRIHDFFPEIRGNDYRAAVDRFFGNIVRFTKDTICNDGAIQYCLIDNGSFNLFEYLTLPREGVFVTGEPRTFVHNNPALALDELFERYVERMFARPHEYQERLFEKDIRLALVQWGVAKRFHKKDIGNELYKVQMPFTRTENDNVIVAIKPLVLDRRTQVDIARVASHFASDISMLEQLKMRPELVAVATITPKENAFRDGVDFAYKVLREQKIEIVERNDIESLRQFV